VEDRHTLRARRAAERVRGLVFAYKLLDMASQRWRKLDGSALLPLVRAGVRFIDGVQVERDDQHARKEAA
jgi:type II secretory pathway component PulL